MVTLCVFTSGADPFFMRPVARQSRASLPVCRAFGDQLAVGPFLMRYRDLDIRERQAAPTSGDLHLRIRLHPVR